MDDIIATLMLQDETDSNMKFSESEVQNNVSKHCDNGTSATADQNANDTDHNDDFSGDDGHMRLY